MISFIFPDIVPHKKNPQKPALNIEEYQINITRPSVRVPPRYTPPVTMSSLFKNGAATELDPYAPVKKHAVLFYGKEFLMIERQAK